MTDAPFRAVLRAGGLTRCRGGFWSLATPTSWAQLVLFFVLSLLYVRWIIDPPVLFDAFGFIVPYPTWDGSLWSSSRAIRGTSSGAWGSPRRRSTTAPWWGARAIASTAFLLWLGTRALIGLIARKGPDFPAYVPPVLLLAAFTAFEHPLARYDDYQGPQTSALALAFGLWHAVLYTAIGSRLGPRLRLAAFPFLCFSAHFLAGGAVLVLAALAAVVEACARRWLAGGGLPGGRGRPALGPDPPPLRPDPRRRHHPAGAPELLDPPRGVRVRHGHVALGARRGGRGRRLEPHPAGRGSGDRRLAAVALPLSDGPAHRRPPAPGRGGDRPLLGRPAAGLPRSRPLLSRREMWAELLETVRRRPGAFDHPFLQREALRALYHTGRLGDDLFSLPVSAAAPPVPWLSLPRDRDPQLWDHAQVAGLALDLGDINRAEHFHHELLEGAGEHPAVLRRLALINLAKGRPETARVFLNALGPARAGDPAAMEERARYLRSVMFLEDDVSFIEDAPPRAESTATLEALLERNPANRMAFEYLVARYLINGQAAEAAGHMWRLAGLGYRRIPRHYEEAILVHQFTTGERVAVPGLRVSEETRRRFEAYRNASRQLRSDLRLARERLAPEFGDGFFYYRTFGRSGA